MPQSLIIKTYLHRPTEQAHCIHRTRTQTLLATITKNSLRLCLDVGIGAWILELALGAANAGCLDVVEFRIGNRAQCQPGIHPTLIPYPQSRARPLCIRWHSLFPVLASLSPSPPPPTGRRATPPSPSRHRRAVPPSPPSAGGLASCAVLPSFAGGPANRAALPLPSQAGAAALPSFRRWTGEPRRSPLHMPAGCAGLPYLTLLVGCATVPSLRRRASLRRPCAPWAADLDDSAARLPFAAELGPSPLSMGAGGAPTVKELHGRAELWTGERG